jgi:hypothetical protein
MGEDGKAQIRSPATVVCSQGVNASQRLDLLGHFLFDTMPRCSCAVLFVARSVVAAFGYAPCACMLI